MLTEVTDDWSGPSQLILFQSAPCNKNKLKYFSGLLLLRHATYRISFFLLPLFLTYSSPSLRKHSLLSSLVAPRMTASTRSIPAFATPILFPFSSRNGFQIISKKPPNTFSTCTPRAEMMHVSIPIQIQAPSKFCYTLFSDLSTMPKWSSTLQAVERDPNDPIFSDWKFSWNGIKLSWRAKDILDPLESQQQNSIPAVRWKSVSGLLHTGLVTFQTKEQFLTQMVMSVDYDVEGLLALFMQSSFVSNFVERAIQSDLCNFRSYALRMYRRAKISNTTSF